MTNIAPVERDHERALLHQHRRMVAAGRPDGLVVTCVDEPAPIAIPTTRIQHVELATELYPPPVGIPGW